MQAACCYPVEKPFSQYNLLPVSFEIVLTASAARVLSLIFLSPDKLIA